MPVVIRSVVGGGGRFGAIHSQMPVSWLMGVPGIKIVAPSTPADAKALLRAAIDDDNPVLFFEHKRLYAPRGRGRTGASRALGEAAVVRAGPRRDARLGDARRPRVPGRGRDARGLRDRGRGRRPADAPAARPGTVLASLQRTNRLVVVEEGPLTGGWAGEVLALAVEHGLSDLDDAWRIATPDNPIPYSPPLEDAHLPGADRIAAEISRRLR